MARTIQEIYDQIIERKQAVEELQGLTSPSQTSIFRLWSWVTASAIHFHEIVLDQFIDDVERRLDEKRPGSLEWYRSRTLEFQYSPTALYYLTVQDGRVAYNTVVPEDRIIARCATTETAGGVVEIKVAKKSGDDLVPLSEAETIVLRGYISKFKDAGTQIKVVTRSADLLRLPIKVYYDAAFVPQVIQTNVEAAIQNYIAEGIEFNGEFYRSKLQDAIQSVNGVTDVELGNLTIGESIAINRKYKFSSGYGKIDPATPLADTIQYIAA